MDLEEFLGNGGPGGMQQPAPAQQGLPPMGPAGQQFIIEALIKQLLPKGAQFVPTVPVGPDGKRILPPKRTWL